MSNYTKGHHEMSTAPSSIARRVAAHHWGAVQHSEKLAPGIYWHSTASHGGAVAIIGVADLPAEAVDAARATGRIGTEHDGAVRVECWVGEEDCDYATLALVSPAMRAGMSKWHAQGELTEREVRETCEHWAEDFLAALEPGYVPSPDGPIVAQERRRILLERGELLLSCAEGDWAAGVPAGWVRISFAGVGDEHRERVMMRRETYARRSELDFGMQATISDFERLGEVLRDADMGEEMAI